MSKELISRILSSIILIPIVFFLFINKSNLFSYFLILTLLITFYEWNKICKKIMFKILGFIYLIFSFYTAYKLENFNESYIYFLFVIILCIATDIGGYVFGNLFKGPKLTHLSPKKTISGLIGGYILAFLASFIFLNFSHYYSFNVNFSMNFIIFVFLISSVSQLGDIFISYFKRLSKMKDTGKLIPGHGGLLDRIDGMIFALPFSYIILSTKILKIF